MFRTIDADEYHALYAKLRDEEQWSNSCRMMGLKIMYSRKEIDFGQDKMAHLLGISRTKLNRWECGVYFPDAKELLKISMISQRPVGWFFEP